MRSVAVLCGSNQKPDVALLCVSTNDQMIQSNLVPPIRFGFAHIGVHHLVKELDSPAL